MKRFLIGAVVMTATSLLSAQDAVKTDPTHYKVIVDTPSVRILRIAYAPGDKSTTHSHPDAVVVPLSASTVKFTKPDGTSQDMSLASESASYMPAGTHVSTNIGKTRADAVLVEFKTAAPGKATIPTTREGLAIKVLAEGPRATAYRSTIAPTFTEAAGTTHDYDQVVIALGPSQVSLALSGKPAKTTWARGDVVFIPRGTGHESKNSGGKPADVIIVAIK